MRDNFFAIPLFLKFVSVYKILFYNMPIPTV